MNDMLKLSFYSDLCSDWGWSSRRGCRKNNESSSILKTVCECDHLTHFAILLSPSPPNYSATVQLSLSIIGYVGVGISVLAMALTVNQCNVRQFGRTNQFDML